MEKSVGELTKAAKALAWKLKQGLKHLPGGTTLNANTNAGADTLLQLSNLLTRTDKAATLGEVEHLFKSTPYEGLITPEATVGSVRQHLHALLTDSIEKVQSSKALPTIKENKIAAAEELNAAKQAAKKEGGFLQKHLGSRISKGFQKHEEWMKSKTPAARMGFAVGEMVLGSVAMEVGSQMLSQSMSGLKQQQLQQVDSKDGKRTTVLVMAPLTGGERAFKAVVGAGATAAGLVATGLGFYGIFRSHEL